MLEGLFISLVGMGAVFVSLTIIMFLMIGIERIFRSEEPVAEEISVVGGGITPIGPFTERVAPESQVEVAAIVLALASYMKGRGRQVGRSIDIDGVHYRVEVGDTTGSTTSVVVNGEMYRGSIGDHGLSMNVQTGLRIEMGVGDRKRGRIWRTAHPLLQGGYWTRPGWTGRHGGGRERS